MQDWVKKYSFSPSISPMPFSNTQTTSQPFDSALKSGLAFSDLTILAFNTLGGA
ncbi:hypothetical protein [Thermoactinomyces mirandus]|uniref:hypothetical protein n=1 Tax=Thermoactinomyces mirandus TaxID=2756294 RepID=UPI0015EF9A61|nr:hypothetical protein [Thermoactinomyces mirandus]